MFGISRDQGTCVVAADVVLPPPNSVPPNSLTGFDHLSPLRGGGKREENGTKKERKGKEGKGQTGWEENTPRNIFLVTALFTCSSSSSRLRQFHQHLQCRCLHDAVLRQVRLCKIKIIKIRCNDFGSVVIYIQSVAYTAKSRSAVCYFVSRGAFIHEPLASHACLRCLHRIALAFTMRCCRPTCCGRSEAKISI